MNPLDVMKALTEPVWERPTSERQLPKLGRGRPSKEVQRERERLATLGYIVPNLAPPSELLYGGTYGNLEDSEATTYKGGEHAENHSPARADNPPNAPLPSLAADSMALAPLLENPSRLTTKERLKYAVWAENMQESIDRMEAAGAWHSVEYQTAKRDEYLRLANGG